MKTLKSSQYSLWRRLFVAAFADQGRTIGVSAEIADTVVFSDQFRHYYDDLGRFYADIVVACVSRGIVTEVVCKTANEAMEQYFARGPEL